MRTLSEDVISCCNCNTSAPKDEAVYYRDHGEYSCDACQGTPNATHRACLGKNCPCIDGEPCPPVDEVSA